MKTLQKRYNMIHWECKNKSHTRIKELKLYYKGNIVPVKGIASWPESQICLLPNCQSARSFDRRPDFLKLAWTSDANFVFLTESWLSGEINKSEIYLGACYQIISLSDREVGEYEGFLIASRSNCDLEAVDWKHSLLLLLYSYLWKNYINFG